MKILAAIAFTLAAAPAMAQLSAGPAGSVSAGSTLSTTGAGSSSSLGTTTGTTSPSMPGQSFGGSGDPSTPMGSSLGRLGPLGGEPGNPLGATPGNPLGRTPSTIPSGVGAGLGQQSSASGLPTPGSSITDAGSPAGAPLGGSDADPNTPN